MFSFVDSRTVLLLVASQVCLLALVRCQDDDRKWQLLLPLSELLKGNHAVQLYFFIYVFTHLFIMPIKIIYIIFMQKPVYEKKRPCFCCCCNLRAAFCANWKDYWKSFICVVFVTIMKRTKHEGNGFWFYLHIAMWLDSRGVDVRKSDENFGKVLQLQGEKRRGWVTFLVFSALRQ